jgi:hypothetical protein
MVRVAYTKSCRSIVLFIRICGSPFNPDSYSGQVLFCVTDFVCPQCCKSGSLIRDKHPGSLTLVWRILIGTLIFIPPPTPPPTRIRILPPNMILIWIFPICIYKATGFVIWSCVTNLIFLQICHYVLGTVSTSPAKAVPRPGTGVRATAPTSVGPQPSSGRLPTPSSRSPGLTHTLQDFCPTLPGKWIFLV